MDSFSELTSTVVYGDNAGDSTITRKHVGANKPKNNCKKRKRYKKVVKLS